MVARAGSSTATTSNETKSERSATETKTVVPAGARYGRHMTMPLLQSDTYADIALPDLREFDLTQIADDATVVAVGKRRTGKSWIFRDIMHAKKDSFTAGIIFSQTDELNKFWRSYVPAKFIYKKYSPAILNQVFERKKNPKQQSAHRGRKGKVCSVLYPARRRHQRRHDPLRP